MRGRWVSRPRITAMLTATLVTAAAITATACSGSSQTVTRSAGPPSAAAAPSVATGQNAMPLPAPTVDGTLAFAKVTRVDDEGHGSGDICVVRTDGTGLTRLTSGAADESQPAWSPDGTRIAFAQRALYKGGWAGALGLAVVNADGSGLRKLTLTSDPHVGDQFGAWAPDGRIFFLRVRIGDVLWVDPDGSGFTRVTTGGGHGAFALSPDGKQLAVYDREHDHLVLLPASGGGTPVILIDDMSRYVPSLSVRLAWSPDGTAIAFAASSEKARTWFPPGSALYIVNADGSGLSVVPNTGRVWDPAWQSG